MVTQSRLGHQFRPKFTAEQAERTRELCQTISRVPGMVIAPFNWHTATTFWDGFMHGMDGDPFRDFRQWGLQHLGSPNSNLSPLGVLARRFAVPGDWDVTLGSSLSRERATEVATMMCDVILAYVENYQQSATGSGSELDHD